jgi:hypothetical protein
LLDAVDVPVITKLLIFEAGATMQCPLTGISLALHAA